MRRCCEQLLLLLILSIGLTLGHVHLCVRDDGLPRLWGYIYVPPVHNYFCFLVA